MNIEDTIRDQIKSNSILLYMKGSPDQPQCGFSAQTVRCLMSCGKRFAFVDVLANPEIRATLPAIANWPTFPQLYVDGELVGGCDTAQARASRPDASRPASQGAGHPPRLFHLLTIVQNSCAVFSASYFAECASLLLNSIPAASQARASTVCP